MLVDVYNCKLFFCKYDQSVAHYFLLQDRKHEVYFMLCSVLFTLMLKTVNVEN